MNLKTLDGISLDLSKFHALCMESQWRLVHHSQMGPPLSIQERRRRIRVPPNTNKTTLAGSGMGLAVPNTSNSLTIEA